MERTLRILAVDNEPSVTTSLRYVFAGPLYEMTTVASGHDALARLEADSDKFDVIIVDQKMPNLTGVELVSAMRERGVTSKIIVLSAHLLPDVRAAYEKMDVHVMFTKPFDIAELRAAAGAIAA
jgi:DNA-binding response OmpR family regulator